MGKHSRRRHEQRTDDTELRARLAAVLKAWGQRHAELYREAPLVPDPDTPGLVRIEKSAEYLALEGCILDLEIALAGGAREPPPRHYVVHPRPRPRTP